MDQRPERAVSKYWWVRTTGKETWPSKEEGKAIALLASVTIVLALTIYGLLVLVLTKLLGIDRSYGALFTSALLVIVAIVLALGFWLSRPICESLNPGLMKKADENAARRFSRDS